MRQSYTPNLIDVLRSTMENVEQTSGLRADDESLQELRTILNRRVAELECAMAFELSEAASKPVDREDGEDLEDLDWKMAS